ncbi:hypothetical protein TWF281_011451 [Arthrobotrys megalospora]
MVTKNATTTAIYSLPNEILVNIFKNDFLSNTDLTNAQLTCRLFRDNIQPYVTSHRRYNFRVDATGHPTWKLIRRLLKNPDLGSQIVEITVQWERRIASDENTWTPDWNWKPSERVRIGNHCRQWDIDAGTESNILNGKNSEALLFFLLFFTPNLHSLDLGDVDERIIDNTAGNHLAIEALGSYRQSDPDEEYLNQYRGSQATGHGLFLFENLRHKITTRSGTTVIGPERLPPGLTSLRYFTIGRESNRGGHPFKARNLFPLFFLPRIESIEAVYIKGDGFDDRSVDYQPHSEGPSTVKYLKMNMAEREFSDKYLTKIAKITGNLERVVIRESPRKEFEGKIEEDKMIGSAFLQYNRNTLRFSELIINGGGFNDAGEYDAEAERRREVARKQKLFEETRLRRAHIQTKPSVFATIEPELLSYLITFLGRADTFNLMLTCRAVKDTCYRNIWSGFALDASSWGYSKPENQDRFNLRKDNALRLQKIIEAGGTTGFRHLELIEVSYPTFGAVPHMPLIEAILKEIGNGNTPKLNFVRLNFRSYDSNPDESKYAWYLSPGHRHDANSIATCHEFLNTIKQHSEKRTPKDFELHLYMPIKESSALFDLCDLTKLTTLDLSGNEYSELEDAISKITVLTNLLNMLSTKAQLKHLCLHTFRYSGGADYMPKNINLETLREPLNSLQGVLSEITSLRSLEISDHIFHPSFLLLPPKNVTKLSYSGGMSPAWWKKFAEYPFTGVEQLHLACYNLPTKMKLGSVGISGLSRFTIEDARSAYPRDLIDLIVKKNTQLSRECLQVIADQKADMCAQEVLRGIPKIAKWCQKHLSQQLQSALQTCIRESATRAVVGKRSVPRNFEHNLKVESAELLLERFQQEIASTFVTKCTGILRHGLGEIGGDGVYDEDSDEDDDENGDDDDENGDDDDENGDDDDNDDGGHRVDFFGRTVR